MKSARILVANDDEGIRDLLYASLREQGHECDCFADSESAARAIEETPYDLLICDIAMPGNSRLERVRELVEQEDAPPIILITGVPSPETAVAAPRLSLADYIIKPFQFEQLTSSVERTLESAEVLRSIRAIRGTLTEWSDEIGASEQVLAQESSAGRHAMTMGTLTEITLGRISSMMHTLSETASRIQGIGDDTDLDLCRHIPCSRLTSYREALQDTVDVLLETKGAFKSKALAGLRVRLEGLLRES